MRSISLSSPMTISALSIVAGLALALPASGQATPSTSPSVSPTLPANAKPNPAPTAPQTKPAQGAPTPSTNQPGLKPTPPASDKDKAEAKQKQINDDFNKKKAEGAQAGATAGLKFDDPSPDMGKISDEVPVPYAFTFTNVTDRTITLTAVTPGCGCTTLDFQNMKKTFAPGEKGDIKIQFNPVNRRGIEVKHVTVDTDYSPAPRVELNFKVEIQPRVTVEPPTFYMKDIRKGTVGTQTVYVTGRMAGFDVTKWDLQDPDITITREEKTEIKEGDDTLTRIAFKVTASDKLPLTGAGQKRATINFTTTDPKKSIIPLSFTVKVVGSAKVEPENLPLRLNNPGDAWSREIQIQNRDGKSFEILGIESEGPSDLKIVFDVDALPAGMPIGYRIKVSGTAPNATGAVNGKILVRTNLPDQELIEIPVVGAVIAARQ